MTTRTASHHDVTGADPAPSLELRDLSPDPLAPGRGILLGILLGAALWIAVLALARLFT